ncbi:MAG TPA: ATP-binding protein [Rhizomicrobium sp.]|jgi:two-component system cell cycle sensor histidine kinase PleC
MSDSQTEILVAGPQTAGALADPAEALPQTMTCGEIFTWLLEHPAVPAVAILDGERRVAGLVNRLIFLARYAKQYAPELYSRKSILKLATLTPLMVDEHVQLGDLGATLLVENPNALIECFVVTSRGHYRGIVTGEALLRCKLALLQAREVDLSRALAAANEASRAKSNFLALMSHELRTPLNAIIGFSEVLGEEMFGPLGNKRYREYAYDIHGAGCHLLALINDILDLSKAEAGKFDLNSEDVAPGDLIAECLKLMRGRAVNAKLSLTHGASGTMPNLLVDRLRLKQILLNLLSNAVKFTPPGGAIRISTEMDAEGRMIIAVSDTGIGIAPDMIQVALEPFRQISSPFARNAEGTGLGLSLAKALMESHGGQLQLDSALNLGTTARLVFPVARVLKQQLMATG